MKQSNEFISACKSGSINISINLFQQNNFDNWVYEAAFCSACYYGQLETAKWLLSVKPSININDYERAFRNACGNGHLEIAKWFLSIKPSINISAKNEQAFRCACGNGHLETAKWLLSIKPSINISADNEDAFRCACENGHLEIAKWILYVNPSINISAEDDESFRWVCYYGYLETAKWLQTLCPEKYSFYVNEYNEIIYKIITPLNIKGTIQKTNLEICPICQENQEEIQTVDCKHGFCYKCIHEWLNTNHSTCPYCRTCLKNGFANFIS
jgi:hypothetical protein